MPRFVFQLDGVLTHRRHIERERQRDLAIVQQRMRQLEEELRHLDQAVRDASADLRRSRLVGALDMEYLSAHRRFTLSMERKAMSLIQRMALVQREIDEKRQLLIQAALGRKVIEKLRERQYQRWIADLDKRQAAELDEIGTRLSFGLMHPWPTDSGEPA